MAKYRKKPVVIDAEQLTKEMCRKHEGLSMPYMVGEKAHWIYYYQDCAVIETLEGKMKADIGDWIITGIGGEKYPCKPDIFAATYELAE